MHDVPFVEHRNLPPPSTLLQSRDLMPHDMHALIARLTLQEGEIVALLEETRDDDAHHLQHALQCVRQAIVDVQGRLRAGVDGSEGDRER
jgi:hypothetical protein